MLEWDVAAVADHVIADAQNFLKMVRGERPGLRDDPARRAGLGRGVFRVAADDLIEPGRRTSPTSRSRPGWRAEFAVHDWDLATALGLALDDLDPAVAELGLEFITRRT